MNKTKTVKSQGFTLIELIVVIAVIGILATISAIGFGRFQADSRDARRASSASAIAEALEKYYDTNGEYPSCADLKATNVGTTTLRGIDSGTLLTPTPEPSVTNSIKCNSDGNVLTTNGTDFFEYIGDGSVDCKTGSSCVEFSLKYKSESSNEIKTISGRRKTKFATDSITLSSNTVSFTSVNVTWTPVQNATYKLQRATDNNFVNNLVETSYDNPGTAITGLTKGSTYYFRVKATSGASQTTNWSNELTVQTLDIGDPVISSVSADTTTLTPNWNSAANATSYRLEYSPNNFSTFTTVDSIAGTSQAVSGLDQGRIYSFRVYAKNGTYVSAASPTVTQNTTIATPAAPTMATPSNVDNTSYYTTTWTWSAGSACPANTTVQYQRQYSYNTSPTYTSSFSSASAATSFAVTTSQGYTYITYVQARCRSNSTTTIVSPWSAVSSSAFAQGVTPPTNITWAASRSGDRTLYMSTTSTCRSGANAFGHFDEYSGSIKWPAGPNKGNFGWYYPGNYRLVNMNYPNGGIANTFAIPNGYVFSARAYIVCRNSVTGVMSTGVYTDGPIWTWGSNV